MSTAVIILRVRVRVLYSQSASQSFLHTSKHAWMTSPKDKPRGQATTAFGMARRCTVAYRIRYGMAVCAIHDSSQCVDVSREGLASKGTG